MRLMLIEHRKVGVFRKYVCPRRRATILTATVWGELGSADVIYLTHQPTRGEQRHAPKRQACSPRHLASVVSRDLGA